MGGNGCGKSTMLSVLAKTAKLQRGRMVRGAASAALLPQNPKALLVAETVCDELMEWASACGYDEAAAQEQTARLGLAGLGRVTRTIFRAVSASCLRWQSCC
ncbi:MAG: hypothetical protein ACLS3M_12325 [Collinsella sp.]